LAGRFDGPLQDISIQKWGGRRAYLPLEIWGLRCGFSGLDFALVSLLNVLD
jgi:hypothetical protein